MSMDINDTAEKMYSYLAREIGEIFKNRRKSYYNLSMRKIYKKENISIAVISDLENGKKIPRLETFIRLCNCVDLPLDTIFNPKLLKSPKIFKSINFNCRPNDIKRAFEGLANDNYLKEALKVKGLSSEETDNVIKYVDFLLSQKNK